MVEYVFLPNTALFLGGTPRFSGIALSCILFSLGQLFPPSLTTPRIDDFLKMATTSRWCEEKTQMEFPIFQEEASGYKDAENWEHVAASEVCADFEPQKVIFLPHVYFIDLNQCKFT